MLAAGKRAQPPGTSASQWEEMRASRDARVKALSTLSQNSQFVLAPAAAHNIEHDDPSLVAATIQQLLRDLRR